MIHAPADIPADWLAILQALPGYDPLAQADGFLFYDEKASKVLAFFSDPDLGMIRHVKGEHAGEVIELALWQQAILTNLFGWVDEKGRRRYREALIYLPRKNGKSTLIAGIGAYVTYFDNEPGAENYVAAADRDQASLLYNITKGMILSEPELEKRAKVFNSSKTIEVGESFFRAISSEANSKHGYNAHCVIVDELHAQPNAELVEVLQTSQGSRAQPLLISITTADYARPSICNEKREYALSVCANDGDRAKPGYDPRFLPVIYEAQVDEDWTSPEVWQKANPNLGISISREWFEREFQRAKETPSYENTFKRLHLNIRTESAQVWLPMEKWDQCAEPPQPFDRRRVYIGVDLSTILDVTAAVRASEDEHGLVDVQCRFYIPEENARLRERKDKVPYTVWARQGWLTMTPGDVVDYAWIKRDILADCEAENVVEVAIDRWNAQQITTELLEEGLTIVPFGQGYKDMSPASKELEARVTGLRMRHGGNPVLRWMAANCMIETDPAGNIKPSKAKSTEKIDGIVALVMALGRLTVSTGPTRSVYETRGIISL